MKNFNLLLKFLLELALLTAFGFFGFLAPNGLILKWTAGTGIPLLVAVFWGMVMAPKAKRRLRGPAYHLVEILLFALACLALVSTQQDVSAIVLGALYLVNKIFLLALGVEKLSSE